MKIRLISFDEDEDPRAVLVRTSPDEAQFLRRLLSSDMEVRSVWPPAANEEVAARVLRKLTTVLGAPSGPVELLMDMHEATLVAISVGRVTDTQVKALDEEGPSRISSIGNSLDSQLFNRYWEDGAAEAAQHLGITA